MLACRVHEMRRQEIGIEAPHADAQMADENPVLRVHLDAVGPGMPAGELDRDAALRRRAAIHERQAPDLLRARHGGSSARWASRRTAPRGPTRRSSRL